VDEQAKLEQVKCQEDESAMAITARQESAESDGLKMMKEELRKPEVSRKGQKGQRGK
jgi:hypothetical protein